MSLRWNVYLIEPALEKTYPMGSLHPQTAPPFHTKPLGDGGMGLITHHLLGTALTFFCKISPGLVCTRVEGPSSGHDPLILSGAAILWFELHALVGCDSSGGGAKSFGVSLSLSAPALSDIHRDKKTYVQCATCTLKSGWIPTGLSWKKQLIRQQTVLGSAVISSLCSSGMRREGTGTMNCSCPWKTHTHPYEMIICLVNSWCL